MFSYKYYPMIAVLAAGLVLFSLARCTDDVVRHHVDEAPDFMVPSAPEYLGTGHEGIIVYAGQDMEVGTMQVSNDQEHLFVSYHITGGWCMMETHVHVATTLEGFPLVGRWETPAPGQFDYKSEHECVAEYQYVIDLGGWEAGDELIIAAHAVVQKADVTETAWAGRDRFAEQGNWATYFRYSVEAPYFSCGDNVTFIYGGQEVTYGTVLSNERCWMDRNLGAGQVATSSTDAEAYGDLFQWGRLADGHQLRNSPTTTTLSSTDQPGHGGFILSPVWDPHRYDWRSPQNDNLWQGLDGVNNPCPAGFRLPTEAEWNAERLSWVSNDAVGAFASPLMLPLAGARYGIDGSLFNVGSLGRYWSSSVSGSHARYLYFDGSNAYMYSSNRAYGYSVRCTKD